MTQKVAVPQKNWANVANPIIYKPTEDGLDTTHLWWFWGWFMALGFRHYHYINVNYVLDLHVFAAKHGLRVWHGTRFARFIDFVVPWIFPANLHFPIIFPWFSHGKSAKLFRELSKRGRSKWSKASHRWHGAPCCCHLRQKRGQIYGKKNG